MGGGISICEDFCTDIFLLANAFVAGFLIGSMIMFWFIYNCAV